MSKKLYILFILLVCMQAVVTAQTVTIFADSAVGKSRSLKAYAASGLTFQDDSIVIRDLRGSAATNNILEQGYCVFDLAAAGIPAGATITSVTLGYYIAGINTGSITSTNFYVNAVAGDLSSNADENIVNGILKHDKLSTSNTLHVNSTGFGSSVGNQTLTLDRSLSWLGAHAGGRVSLIFTERSLVNTATRRTAIMGYTGNSTSTTTAYHRPYITVTYTAPSTCSGTPTAGVTMATPQAGNAETYHVLSLSGASLSDGLTYQWQSSATETGSYTDISGATQRTYSFSSVTATRYYRCAITCGGSTSYSAPTPVLLINTYTCTNPVYSQYFYANYVISTTYPMGAMTINTTITGDSGTVITDSMTASPRSYNNQCNALGQQGLIFYKGNTHVLQVRSAEYNQNWQAWIDFNNNGSFETTELQGSATVGTGSGAVSTVALSAIPLTVPTGYYRMRVVSVYSATLPIPCPTAYTYGNTRDYLVKIGDGPIANATPERLDFGYVTTGSTSPTMSVHLSALYLYPATGTLNIVGSSSFEVSPDSSTWATSYTVAYSAGTYNNRVYVRFLPSGSARYYVDTVYVSGGGLVPAFRIPLSGAGVIACTGTPTAGTTAMTRTVSGHATTYNFNLVGSSLASGLTYQWQSSATGSAGTWNNVSGATTISYSFTTGFSSTYVRCMVTCTASALSDSSSIVLASYVLPSSSCAPTTTNAALACSTYGMVLNKVRLIGTAGFGYLGDSVSCSTTGYNDRTNLRTTLITGNTYTVQMTTNVTYSISTQWWIDFNNNGAFENSETVGGNSSTFIDTGSCSITIPLTVSGGIYRMRVFTSYSSPLYPFISPCGGHAYGGARDYTVIIVAGFNPSAVNFRYCVVDSLAVDSSSTFEIANLVPDSGYLRFTASTGFGVSLTRGVYRTMDSIYYRGGSVPPTRIYAYFLPRTATYHTGNVRLAGGAIDTNIQLRMSGRGVFTSCSSGASAGTISSSIPIADDTTAFTIIGVGCDTNGGIESQWQRSLDSATWVDIAGATRDTLTMSGIAQKTFYRRKAFCYFSGINSFSNVVVVHYPHRILAVNLSRSTDCYEYLLTVRINSGLPSVKIVTHYGDGTLDTMVFSTTTYTWPHTYAMSGSYSIRCKLYKADTLFDSILIAHNVSFCNTIKIRSFYDTDSNCVKTSLEDFCGHTNRVKIDSAGYIIDTFAYLGSLNYSAYGPVGTIYRCTPIEDTAYWRILCAGSGYFTDTLRSGGYVPSIHYVPLKNRSPLYDFGMTSFGGFSRIRNGNILLYPRLLRGVDTINSTINYRISPRMRVIAISPMPTSISTDSLEYTWVFSRFRSSSIWLRLRRDTGLFALGDTFYSAGQIGPLTGDVRVSNNFVNRCDTVVASYDPNYIESDPSGCITSGITTEYTVGFENTGSDTAYNVHVLDTLSGYLDPRTLEPTMSSHPMVLETRYVAGMTIVKFDFPNIKLLDSSQPHGNHGMFRYKIRVRSGLADGTLISSRVGIYFDDNDVVMTNTQVNTINCPVYVTYPTVESVGGARVGGTLGTDNLLGSNDLKVYPNPVNDELHIEASLSQYDECVVTNTMGKVIWSSKLQQAHQMIATKQWPSGIYFVQIKGAMGSRTIKLVKQ